jgi:hypothetical protein
MLRTREIIQQIIGPILDSLCEYTRATPVILSEHHFCTKADCHFTAQGVTTVVAKGLLAPWGAVAYCRAVTDTVGWLCFPAMCLGFSPALQVIPAYMLLPGCWGESSTSASLCWWSSVLSTCVLP